MALANITNNILTDTGVNVSSLTPTSTTISTTAPLQGGGDLSANRTLSITQSSASVNGYLSSGDWTIFNSKQPAGTYITSLTGEATGTGPGATAVTLNNASVTAKILTGVNITGGTVQATDTMLTAFGKLQNQINGLVGGSIYQGTWNAATNTPALASGVGVQGYYYIVSVAGTTNLDGITDWFVGDWAIFNGGVWQQVDNTDAVVSVNGQTGAVSLTTDNIPEGTTNQYYLNSRARAALSFTAGSGAYNSTTGVITIPTNTSQLTNGANFITLASLSGTAPIVYSNTTGAISITQSGTASNGYLSSTDWNTFNNKQATITLTTTGTSGAATLVGTTLNVPNYGGALTGYVPYTGATANVDLGAYSLTAGAATLTSNLWLKNTGSYDFIISNNTSLTTNVVRAYYTTTDELRFYAKNTAGASVVPKIMVGDGTTFTQLGTGTVTSVAALTIGTSGTDVSSTVANSTTTPVITLNVPTASATNRGVLASADWTTFNNKQSALTNPVTGTGTTNYLPKFTGASTIGNSLVYDNGTNIAIGGTTITDGNMLNVIGNQSSVNVGLVLNNTNSTYARIYSIQNVNSNFVLYDYTASAARLTMTSTGNLGLGVTPTTLDAGGVNLQIKDRSAFFQLAAVNSTYLSNNIYYDGAWKRFASGYGTMIRLTDDNNGISFYTTGTGAANSAASLTQAMTLTAAGRLLINKTNEETYQLDVNGTGRFSGNFYANTGTGANFRAVFDSTNIVEISNYSVTSGYQGLQIIGSPIKFYTGTAGAGSATLALTIATNQAATFSSSVTAAQLTISGSTNAIATINSTYVGGGFLQMQASGTVYGYVGCSASILSGTTNDFVIVSRAGTLELGANSARGLIFSTSNAATFSSSVQAQKLSIAAGTFAAFSLEVDQQSTFAFGSTNGKRIAIIRDSTAADSGLQFGYDATDKTGIIAGSATSAGAGIDFYTFNGTAWGNRMRITNTGNVGIGTSSPTGLLHLYGADPAFRIQSSTTGNMQFGQWDGGNNRIQSSGRDFLLTQTDSFNMLFHTNSTERMRITSGGNVLIGTTDDGGRLVSYSTTAATQIKAAGTAPAITFSNTVLSPTYGGVLGTCTSANQFLTGTSAGDMVLANQFSGYRVYIASYSGGVYLTSGATSWTANSDIRLKNINSHIENAVEKLSTLQTINFSYKDDKTNKQNLGLIAQEVEKIFPELIDKNGDGMLGVRYTELVPVLIKAVQELKLEIETLKNK